MDKDINFKVLKHISDKFHPTKNIELNDFFINQIGLSKQSTDDIKAVEVILNELQKNGYLVWNPIFDNNTVNAPGYSFPGRLPGNLENVSIQTVPHLFGLNYIESILRQRENDENLRQTNVSIRRTNKVQIVTLILTIGISIFTASLAYFAYKKDTKPVINVQPPIQKTDTLQVRIVPPDTTQGRTR